MQLFYKSISIFNLNDDQEFYYTDFKKNFNVINGTNRVGKSTIAKAIFFALGADIALDNLSEQIADLAVILEVEVNDKIYFFINRTTSKNQNLKETQLMFLNDQQEILFLCEKNKVKDNYMKFSNSILKHFNLWDWIKLRTRSDKEIWYQPCLATLFDFFYVEQEEWVNDFNNFKKETTIFKTQDLEMLIGIFLNTIQKADFDLIASQEMLRNEINELEFSKQAYIKILTDINNKNGISGCLDQEYINNYINIKNLISKQNKHFLKLKEYKSLMMSKVALNQLLKEYQEQFENIDLLANFFPQELTFINKHGECENLSFNDVITFKSKKADSQADIKEVKQKLKILNNKLNILQREIDHNQTIYFKGIKEKSCGRFDLSKLQLSELETILKLNHNLNFEINELTNKIQLLKKQQINTEEQWSTLLAKNQNFLTQLTTSLNQELVKLYQGVKLNYYLNQLNSESAKRTNISGTDKVFYKLVQKGLYYNFVSQSNCKIVFPLVIDTINKDDFHEENWKIVCQYISKTYREKTQLILLSTRMPVWDCDFNLVKLKSVQRALIKNNDFSLIPNVIKEIKAQILTLLESNHSVDMTTIIF